MCILALLGIVFLTIPNRDESVETKSMLIYFHPNLFGIVFGFAHFFSLVLREFSFVSAAINRVFCCFLFYFSSMHVVELMTFHVTSANELAQYSITSVENVQVIVVQNVCFSIRCIVDLFLFL